MSSNPYDAHPALSHLEAQVLWEYAKLAQNIAIVFILCPFSYCITAYLQVNQKTRLLSEQPDKLMLAKLRILEKKMGIVLTLVCTHLLSISLSFPHPSSSRLPFGLLSINNQITLILMIPLLPPSIIQFYQKLHPMTSPPNCLDFPNHQHSIYSTTANLAHIPTSAFIGPDRRNSVLMNRIHLRISHR